MPFTCCQGRPFFRGQFIVSLWKYKSTSFCVLGPKGAVVIRRRFRCDESLTGRVCGSPGPFGVGACRYALDARAEWQGTHKPRPAGGAAGLLLPVAGVGVGGAPSISTGTRPPPEWPAWGQLPEGFWHTKSTLKIELGDVPGTLILKNTSPLIARKRWHVTRM